MSELQADNRDLRDKNESLSERVAGLEAGSQERAPGRGVGALRNKTVKSVVVSKAVGSLAELTDDKNRFRQWDVKLINTLAHLNRGQGWAMEVINECLDKGGDPREELLLDKMSGTLGAANGDHSVDVVELNSDLEYIMLDKAKVGSNILHRVNNAKPRGGIHMYAEVYKWFAEMSGPAGRAGQLFDESSTGKDGGRRGRGH